MSEICTEVKKLEEGKPYIPGPHEIVITESHTIADIVRWMVSEGWEDEVLFLLLESKTGAE